MSEKNNKKLKVAYIHGRVGPHIMHGRLAKSVNGEFFKVDEHKRWHDIEIGKLFKIYAWIYNAFSFKNPAKYDVFLVSGPHFSPIIMKYFRLKKRQKVLVHLGDETMYFLYSNWYSKFMKSTLIFILNRYDGLICEGQMAADLAKLNGVVTPTYTTYLGAPKERYSELLRIQPNMNSKNIVFLSSGPGGWRTWYKGLDLMIAAFNIAFQKDQELSFTIIGDWDISLQNELLSKCSVDARSAIHFVGYVNDLERYFSEGSLYLHCARGDAFPTVVIEAIAAGLIPLVSEWTGNKEIVQMTSEELIVPLDKEIIAEKIIWYMKLPVVDKEELSKKLRKTITKFTEENALIHYQDTFDKIRKDFNI
jgi:glycosyltransferase involved in cell wall biosynthesis